jgi:hypothetical protein
MSLNAVFSSFNFHSNHLAQTEIEGLLQIAPLIIDSSCLQLVALPPLLPLSCGLLLIFTGASKRRETEGTSFSPGSVYHCQLAGSLRNGFLGFYSAGLSILVAALLF